MLKRSFDLIFAALLLFCLSILLVVISIVIKLTSPGHVLYWSDRVGVNNNIFKMCKFRTMRVDAPAVATHLFKDANHYLTPIGIFLRKFSLDELPQLLNIITGDMSFVGPRPALFNQSDLIELRTKKNVHTLTPGITGWAQVKGRDALSIPIKVNLDEYYLKNRSFFLDLRILAMTIIKVIRAENIVH